MILLSIHQTKEILTADMDSPLTIRQKMNFYMTITIYNMAPFFLRMINWVFPNML